MSSIVISSFNSIKNTCAPRDITIDLLLDNIRDGYWQDQVSKVRTATDDDSKKKAKAVLPNVTISGKFKTRKDQMLIEHSGFICMDIDKLGVRLTDTKEKLKNDPYVYSIFLSCGGHGLAVLFRINKEKHIESFMGLSEYLFTTYEITVDQSCKNVSRTRFVSFDPDLYINETAKVFRKYPKAKYLKTPRPKGKTIFVQNDFDAIISKIQRRNIDLTYNYHDWLRIGFALADKFGESGRSYFHSISEISSKYKANITNSQYTACVNGKGSGVKIGTFYYYVKEAGIQIYSDETRKIIQITASQRRNAGVNTATIIQGLKDHSEYDHELIEEIVPQVDDKTMVDDISEIEQIEAELRNGWEIRRNVISRYLEINESGVWKNVDDNELNSIWLKMKRTFPKMRMETIQRILLSKETEQFNPFLDFIKRNRHCTTDGNFAKLSNCITSLQGLKGANKQRFITKWFVGMIASIYGGHSPLLLVLCGEKHGTGKTEFFRRLLPKELRSYQTESKLDAGKDDDILMCQKLLISDDEFSGKNKRDSAKLKEKLSKQSFSLREPYGKANVDLKRLAVLAGTSNNDNILNDPTGNRRVIPIHVAAMDHDLYNSIDKAELFMEAVRLFESDYKWQVLGDDIDILNNNSKDFEAISLEEELFSLYFRVPIGAENGKGFLTSQIKAIIERETGQRLGTNNLGSVIKKVVGKKTTYRNDEGKQTKGWKLIYDNSGIIESSLINECKDEEVKQFEAF